MKRLVSVCAVVVFVAGASQAAIQTYSIVDYPLYQADTKYPSYTDQVSGTILADPDTGVISSATFTITAGNGGASYTVALATIDPYFVQITATQILVTPYNPSNSLGYGNLRLSGSTGLSGSNASAVIQWYTPGDPWIAGSNNWAGYTGTVGSKGSGPLFASSHDATPWTIGGTSGTYDTMVVATVVPEPMTMALLGLGGLMLRRRSA